MEKSSITMADIDAIEVRTNHLVAPRMGMNQLSFRAMVIQEREAAKYCEKIIEERTFPPLMRKLNNFCDFSKEVREKLQEFSFVLNEVVNLINQGFHVQIITAMLGCASGCEAQFGDYGRFDAKFTRALIDKVFRKQLLGTEYRFPRDLAKMLLIDLMSNVYPDNLCEDNIRRSELVRYYLSFYPGKEEQKLEEFIKFCQV